jgi:hypothetical protein
MVFIIVDTLHKRDTKDDDDDDNDNNNNNVTLFYFASRLKKE